MVVCLSLEFVFASSSFKEEAFPNMMMNVCALNSLFPCLSSAQNEDKSGGWIREKNRPEKIFRVYYTNLRQRGTFLHFQQKRFLLLRARSKHTHVI